jgi:hypothetical protein
MNLKFGSSFGEELAIFRRQTAEAPVFSALLMLPYLAGQVITWRLIWSTHRHANGASQI